MAKKKAVEPPTIDTEMLVKELQKKRLEATAQEQIAIDQQLLELTTNEEK
jgi:hypothetical protein